MNNLVQSNFQKFIEFVQIFDAFRDIRTEKSCPYRFQRRKLLGPFWRTKIACRIKLFRDVHVVDVRHQLGKLLIAIRMDKVFTRNPAEKQQPQAEQVAFFVRMLALKTLRGRIR